MKTITRYLDEAKRYHKLETDYALSRKLGVPANHISHWYSGACRPDDEAAVRLALVLGVDPVEIITCVNYHRTLKSRKRESDPKKNAARRKFWRQVYDRAVRGGGRLWVGRRIS